MIKAVGSELIRLTSRQKLLLEKLTGHSVNHIKTLKQLGDFVEFHASFLPESEPETRLMRKLIFGVLEDYV